MACSSLIVVLSLACLGTGDPDQFPLALHRSMEIDDLDREIQRIHDTVLLKQAQLAASQRLSQRGLLSRSELEREASDVRYQEAREAETIAYRALKLHERDVLGHVAAADERKSYALLLDWVRKQGAIAQVEVDYQSYLLKQTQALYQRRAASRQELEDVELAVSTAKASVALSRSREAQVMMELAARTGVQPYDRNEFHRLKTEYLKARVHYYEVTAEGARRRLEVVRERTKLGLIGANEVSLFEKAASDADASLDAEKKALSAHEASKPTSQSARRRTS
jgi:hypothetical protein